MVRSIAAMGNQKSWKFTNMVGSLEVAQIDELNIFPTVLRLVKFDKIGERRGILLEYELPINFVFNPAQTALFSSIQIANGH
jgi:hypothetical protein